MMIARSRALTPADIRTISAKPILVEMMIARSRALTQPFLISAQFWQGDVEMMIARSRALTPVLHVEMPVELHRRNDDCPF